MTPCSMSSPACSATRPSGRLYKALVDNKKAVGASMGVDELHDPGFMIASVSLKLDQSLDEARQIMLKTVEGVVSRTAHARKRWSASRPAC